MESIDSLKKLGLSEYESKAYLALIRYGTQSGREVSKKSGVPPTRVFDILKSLVDKGLVNLTEEKPMLFRAIEPDKGLKGMVEGKIDDMRSTESELLKSLEILKVPSEHKIHEKITTVIGFKKMYSMVVAELNNTKKEFVVFSVGEDTPFSLKAASRSAFKRGVSNRLIVTRSDEENKHMLRERADEGYKLRHYPSTGEWTFAVFDKRVAMINVRNPNEKEERISIFFEIPDMAKSLAEYFEVMWAKAKPVKI